MKASLRSRSSSEVLSSILLFGVALVLSTSVYSSDRKTVTHLIYEEREQFTGEYEVDYWVGVDHIRIEDGSSDDGYILYDLEKDTIYSVSHYDESILVIPDYGVPDDLPEVASSISYQRLEGAPTIAGKSVYNYRVTEAEEGRTCIDMQIAEGLLPMVTERMKRYREVIAAQQMRNIEVIPEEYRKACYMIEQVLDEGDYYSKGLPINERFSDKLRRLKTYKEIEIDAEKFTLPPSYRQFRLEQAFDHKQ